MDARSLRHRVGAGGLTQLPHRGLPGVPLRQEGVEGGEGGQEVDDLTNGSYESTAGLARRAFRTLHARAPAPPSVRWWSPERPEPPLRPPLQPTFQPCPRVWLQA